MRRKKLRRVVVRPEHLVHKDQQRLEKKEQENFDLLQFVQMAFKRGGGSLLSNNEKRLAAASFVFSALAIASFTSIKWDVEKKLENLPKNVQQDWRQGSYSPNVDASTTRKDDNN